jgi:hypothetical protein
MPHASACAKSGEVTALLKVCWNFACLQYGAKQPLSNEK